MRSRKRKPGRAPVAVELSPRERQVRNLELEEMVRHELERQVTLGALARRAEYEALRTLTIKTPPGAIYQLVLAKGSPSFLAIATPDPVTNLTFELL